MELLFIPAPNPPCPLLPFCAAVKGDQHPLRPKAETEQRWSLQTGKHFWTCTSQPCCVGSSRAASWEGDAGFCQHSQTPAPKRTCGTSRWMQGTFLG